MARSKEKIWIHKSKSCKHDKDTHCPQCRVSARFHDLCPPGSIKKNPPIYVLCTQEEAHFKTTSKGKKRRTPSEYNAFLEALFQARLAKQLAEVEASSASSLSFRSLTSTWLDQISKVRSRRTVKDYGKTVEYALQAFTGDFEVSGFSQEKASFLTNWLRKELQLTDRTIHKHITTLETFFKWCSDNQICSSRPFKKPRKIKKEPRIYSNTQMARLLWEMRRQLHSANGRMKMFKQNLLRAVRLARYTGMRSGEILFLQLQDIDLEKGFILLRSKDGWAPKNRKERRLPLSGRLKRLLTRDLSRRNFKETWFLDDGTGSRVYSNQEHLARALTLINKSLGIEGVKPFHGIRAWVITRALERGVEITLVQNFVGHADLQTTKSYQNTVRQDTKVVCESI